MSPTAGELVYEMSALDNQVAFGVATAGAVGYLEDTIGLAPFTSANQAANLVRKYLLIYEGTGAGQFRTIESWDSTAARASVTPNFTTAPDDTSKYVILNQHPQGYLDALKQSSRRLRSLKPRPYATPLIRQAEIPGNLVKNGLFRLYEDDDMPEWELAGAGNDDGAYEDAEESVSGWGLKFTNAVTLTQTLRLSDYSVDDTLTVYVLAHTPTEDADISVQLGADDAVKLPVGWNWTKADHTVEAADLSSGLILTIKPSTAAIDGIIACAWAERSPIDGQHSNILRLPADADLDSFGGDIEVSAELNLEAESPRRLRAVGHVPREAWKVVRNPNLTLVLPSINFERRIVRWQGYKLLPEINSYADSWDGDGVTALRNLAEAYIRQRRSDSPESIGVSRRLVEGALIEARQIAPYHGGETLNRVEAS